jgi:hypothetical protein
MTEHEPKSFTVQASGCDRRHSGGSPGQVMADVAVAFQEAQMGSVTGLYENKPSVAAVFPLLGPEAVEP